MYSTRRLPVMSQLDEIRAIEGDENTPFPHRDNQLLFIR
jgi:hypothetical protein